MTENQSPIIFSVQDSEVQNRSEPRTSNIEHMHAKRFLAMSDLEIHPTAIVDSMAELGAGTIVGPYCIVASKSSSAKNAGCKIM